MCRALVFSLASILVGCRTAGPQVRMQNCSDFTVRVDGDVSASQAKSVPVDVLNEPTVSASQNGDANATRATLAAEEGE